MGRCKRCGSRSELPDPKYKLCRKCILWVNDSELEDYR